MWVVIKYKKNQYCSLSKELMNTFGKGIKFYKPTIRFEKSSIKKKIYK